MYYCYILKSLKSGIFYIDTTDDIERGVLMHNGAHFASTRAHLPWELIWENAFGTQKEARDFAQYLKSSDGRNYIYKRLISSIYETPVDDKKKFFEA